MTDADIEIEKGLESISHGHDSAPTLPSPVSTPQPEASPGPEAGTGILLDKLLFLGEEITKLKGHIENRKALALKRVEAIRKEMAELDFELEESKRQFLGWRPGLNPAVDSWKSERERRILSLKQMLWDIPEQLERDLVLLERELRELLREYLPLKRLFS